MYKKDFMLRMIEMLAEFVAGILGLIKKGDFKKAAQSIDDAYMDYLQQDAAFFNNLSSDNLPESLLQEHNYTGDHLKILSELFFAQAELAFAQEKYCESREYYRKSLSLLEFTIKESKTFSFEEQAKISSIKNRISELGDGKS